MLFHGEGDQELAQAVQRVGRVSSLETLQRRLGQPAVGAPTWARELTLMTSKDPFHPQPFCDSLYWYCLPLWVTLAECVTRRSAVSVLCSGDIIYIFHFQTNYFPISSSWKEELKSPTTNPKYEMTLPIKTEKKYIPNQLSIHFLHSSSRMQKYKKSESV